MGSRNLNSFRHFTYWATAPVTFADFCLFVSTCTKKFSSIPKLSRLFPLLSLCNPWSIFWLIPIKWDNSQRSPFLQSGYIFVLLRIISFSRRISLTPCQTQHCTAVGLFLHLCWEYWPACRPAPSRFSTYCDMRWMSLETAQSYAISPSHHLSFLLYTLVQLAFNVKIS